MIKRRYHLHLATPAFLGDAEQKGVWRTPPLKALIREWWRIAVARECAYDEKSLKLKETELFGTAADESGGENHKSKIRFALQHWQGGKCTDWPAHEPNTPHTEVKDRHTGKPRPVGTELYLGYGPLENRAGQTRLKKNAALQAEESNVLKLAMPNEFSDKLQTALSLAHWFGTIGGRSRNGWGSLAWQAQGDTQQLPALSKAELIRTGCVRPLRDCLALDWPHAIGSDDKGVFVWQSSKTFATWREAMKFLAETKIDFRTKLGFVGGQPHPVPQPRHVLAYPVTNHRVAPWEGKDKGRLANTLRFKLHTDAEGKLRALIYHTPCKPTLPHDPAMLLPTWQRVHKFLDANPQLTRLA